MLTIATRDGSQAEAVVTVHPMRASGTSLAALALLRIPAPRAERFVDPALMRRQMLDNTFTRIGDTLDIDHLARELIDALVPHFCNAGDLLLLESLIGDDELPSSGLDGSLPLRRIALLHDRKDPGWEAAFPTGEILRFPSPSPYFRCMDTGAPVLETTISREPGQKDRQGLAAPAGRQVAVECVDADAAAHRARHHARLLRLYPGGGVPPVRRVRRRNRHGLRVPRGRLHRQCPPLQPGTRDRADPAAEHAADRAVLPVLGRGQASLPAGQQAHRGRRRLV